MYWRLLRRSTALTRLCAGRSLRRACTASALPAADSALHGFRVQRVRPIPELSATAVQLQHASGVQYLHVARDDANNVFGVGFRTPPSDSSGVAHILEHTTLCGSHRFPARDPFFKMLNRSLATFMNAFTASDWTMYPFSTCNEADFHNLLQVYMDAVFAPRLERLDFLQEGWRLEHQEPHDADSPIVFKGVVFNEMKGALSDRHRYFAEKVQNGLLPSHTYGHCSGGQPLAIPDLSWQQLRDFHSAHYQPANCRMFSYGSLPLEPHLALIHEQYLSSYSDGSGSKSQRSAVPLEPRWSQPAAGRRQNLTCRPDPLAPAPDRQNSVSVSYLLGDVTDVQETFVLQVLCHLLIDGPSAPFYRSLIEPGLGSDFAPHCTGLDNSVRETSFSVGLQGVATADEQRVLDAIEHTVQETISTGFGGDRIEAVIHQIELGLKHQTEMFGLSLLMHSIAPWIHGGDPVDSLRVNDVISEFRRQMADNPRMLEERLQGHMRDNPHRLVTTMTPDVSHEATTTQKEDQLLEARVSALSDTERQEVYRTGLELLSKQDQPQDASCLPMLRVDEITDKPERYETRTERVEDVSVQLSEQPTNGVCYFRALLDVSAVPPYFKPLLPLFCELLTQMGTYSSDYRRLDGRVQLHTGGLRAGVLVSECPQVAGRLEETLLLSSYCLEDNVGHMFDLWKEVLTGVSFDDSERLHSLLQMSAAELANGVTTAGHQYAMGSASAGLTAAARLRQTYSGLEQVRFVRSLVEDGGDVSLLATKLRMLAEMLRTRDGMRCALNATGPGLTSSLTGLQTLLSSMSGVASDDISVQPDFKPQSQRSYVQLPLPVHYAAHSLPIVPYTHADFAPLRVLARLVSLGFLHREIREKGGAYGGGAVASMGGLWSYYSYRDPNSLATLDVFNATADFVRDHQFTSEDIEGAKLGVFQAVDAPVVAADRGMRQFLSRLTDDQFEQHRVLLKRVTLQDLRRVADVYLRRPAVSGTCVLGQATETLDSSWTVEQS